jgi:tetratricopeptide (TPR) repeat protein
MRNHVVAVIALVVACAGAWLPGDEVVAGVPRSGAEAAVRENMEQAFADYTVGVFLLESGSVQAAIPHLESAWEKSSHDATMGSKLAEAYFSAGDLSRCETVVDELLSANENERDALLLKAKVAYLRSRKEEAITYLEKIGAEGEPSFEVQRILASVYLELGMNEKALAAFEEALGMDPNHPLMQYRLGTLLRAAGRLGEAEQAFRTAMRLTPGFADAALELAAMARKRGEYAEAESILVDALDADPANYEVVDTLTAMYIGSGELDKAIRLLESRKEQSPLPDEELILLGRLYYEAKDYDESLAVFEEILQSGTPTADLERVLGEISAKAGKTEKALQYCREAIRLGPDDYRNYLALFIASSVTFTPNEAERIELSPDESLRMLAEAARLVTKSDGEALYIIGVSYQSVDSLVTAREYLGRAAEIRPDDERVLLNLANVLEKMELYEEAVRYVASLHEKQPDDPTTCNFYGYLLALMGKELDKAEKLVRKAIDAEPDNGYYIDSLGWVFFMRGEYDRAVAELERAAKIVENDPTILEHLGDAYEANGRYREAVTAYEKSRTHQRGENEGLLRKIGEARKRAGD